MSLLSHDFELLSCDPCHPLVIPDHARKFQLLLTQKLVLKRK
jgi:hypothetical protein